MDGRDGRGATVPSGAKPAGLGVAGGGQLGYEPMRQLLHHQSFDAHVTQTQHTCL